MVLDTVPLVRIGLDIGEIVLGTALFGAGFDERSTTIGRSHKLLDQFIVAGGDFIGGTLRHRS